MAAARGGHRVCKAIPLCRGLLARGKEMRRALSSDRSSRGGSTRDDDFGALFADVPSSSARGAGKPAGGSSSESDFWKSLVREPSNSRSTGEKKEGVAPSWDFLSELNMSSSRQSSSRAQTFSRSSFRKLGDSGVDFLSEELDRPVTPRSEPAEQQESGEESILKSASFNLLRESFQKSSMQPSRETVGIKTKTLNEALGLDSGTLFSSQEIWSKPVDSRTLAELEGNFYSTLDQAPAEDIKTYTYEELGEKLRQVRPPKEQILYSATGLSFGELRTRFQRIEQVENETPESTDTQSDFKELRESLNQLRPLESHSPKTLAAQKQLSYEELSFLNNIGVRTNARMRVEYTPPKDDLLTKYYSDAQLSSKERLKLEIKKWKEEFQAHECDSGSPQVQIAILTARINNVNRHLREGPNYKRDKHSKKGLNDMVQYRKRMLRYLRRRDWPVYCDVLTKLKLDDVILEKRR